MSLPGFENIDGLTPKAIAAAPKLVELLHNGAIRKSREIEAALGLSDVEVRAVVHLLRVSQHQPICSNTNGYWYATNDTEILDCVDSMRARADSIRNAAAGLYAAYEWMKRERERHGQTALF